MHEYGLAQDLLAAAAEEVRRLGRPTVACLRIEVGELAGVSMEALRAALQVAGQGTAFETATIEIERVPGKLRCEGCGREGAPSELDIADPETSKPWICPRCGYLLLATQGHSLVLKDLVLVDAAAGG